MLEDDIDFGPREGSSTTEQKLREWRRARLRNVFPPLIDRAAFIDTIRLSVDTTGKAETGCLAEAEDQSILRPGSTYSHKIEAKCRLTGNPVRIQYGKVKNFHRIPSHSVTVWSETTPMTGAQINLLTRSLFPNARIRLSMAELTFDVTRLTLREFYRKAVYSVAHTKLWPSEADPKIFYIGSPRSSWFARIYAKKDNVLRIEFKLQRGFFRQHRIERPDDLARLHQLRLQKLVALRNFSDDLVSEVTANWPEVARDFYQRGSYRPLWHTYHSLSQNGVQPSVLLPLSKRQMQLHGMLGQLVW
jgi:hypothetical protein